MSDHDELTPEVAAALLDHLRSTLARPRTNEDGERVWMKKGPPPYMVECCLVDDPCEVHAKLPHGGAS